MNDNNDTGFAGLGKRLDNLPPIKEVKFEETIHAEAPKNDETQAPYTETTPSPENIYAPSVTHPPSNNVPKIIIAIVIVVILAAIFSGNDNKSAKNSNLTSNNTTQAANQAANNIEQIPPVGSGNILGRNEMRYCLSEKIRISKVQSLVDYYSQIEVSNMNRLVDDYNIRCSNFKYRRGSLESVRAEVESNKYTLENEATIKVNSWRASQSNYPINNNSQPPQIPYNSQPTNLNSNDIKQPITYKQPRSLSGLRFRTELVLPVN